MYRIGEFARICRVSVSMLRYYADIGLLLPARIDPDSGYRYYDVAQIGQFNRIVALRDLGFSLDQVAELLSEELSTEQIRGMVRLRKVGIEKQLREELSRLERVEAWLRQVDAPAPELAYRVERRTIPALPVLSIRETLPVLDALVGLYQDTWTSLQREGVSLSGPSIGLYYDTDWTGEQIDMELAFPVAPAFMRQIRTGAGRWLAPRELPAIGQAACLTRSGRYSDFTEAYRWLGQWLATQGLHTRGPGREVYTRPDEEVILQLEVSDAEDDG